MDWLTIAIIGILLVILLIVLCEKHQMQKETELFAKSGGGSFGCNSVREKMEGRGRT